MAGFAPLRETSSPGIEISEEWSVAADNISKSFTSLAPIVFICGAKNSGKTTFSRYLLNTFLPRYKRVAYLDTDVGQPEFTPPGCLSLTIIDEATPDLTIPCLKTPLRCYFFGDVSSKRDPETYLNCIFALYDHYSKDLQVSSKNASTGAADLPLIINTPGWVKGLGFDILVDMLKHMAATHVVKINISSVRKNLPDGAFWLDELDESSVKLVEMTSARKDSYNRSRLDVCTLFCCPGIVRGIDTLKNVIYLITPVPQKILTGVDILLQGYIQIPTGLLQVQGCVSPYMSANVVQTN
ncbi:hypothetical protein SOVF_183670 isoform B [Spinacia oleracea]|nr:hypothetical protein SOVF_183670 isoform B [Spinacia oleracea]